jgi:hypothetical protein
MSARGPRWITCPNGHQYRVQRLQASYRECPQCHTRFQLSPEEQRRLEAAFRKHHRPPPAKKQPNAVRDNGEPQGAARKEREWRPWW